MNKQTEQDIRISARNWCGEIDTARGCSENQVENIALHFFEEGFKNGVKAQVAENKRVKCIYCKEPIHIDNWGGVNKEGFFCNNLICLIELAKSAEKTGRKGNE